MAKTRHRKGAQASRRRGVPDEARYVNTTTLDDDMLERMCRLSESKPMKVLYVGFGAAIVVAAVLSVLLLKGNNGATALIIGAFGAYFVWQGLNLSRMAARKFSRQLDQTGGSRTRETFFTTSEIGNLDEDGSVHTIPYAAVESVTEDERMFGLVLRDDAGIIALDKGGFTRGSVDEFGPSLRAWVAESAARLKPAVRKPPARKGRGGLGRK